MGQPHHRGQYPPDWPSKALAVKQAVNWRCVRCDHAHDPKAGYCLTVHHFDGNKENLSDWNLIPLCQRCHLSVQARVNPAIPILHDPSVWAMPYIAGLYRSGGCLPSPGYDLARWATEYTASGRTWPMWAPVPEVGVLFAEAKP